jgi:hypothetical protein
VVEFNKIAPNGHIQATTHQALTISTTNFRHVRVLSQERHGVILKVTKDLKAPSKKPPLYWIFENGFIQDLPWDRGEWH